VSGFPRTPVDYTNNQRMSRATVQTDAGATGWDLADTADPQFLNLDGRPTTTVTFVVQSVYPGTKYNDVTVAEVNFSELA
jgi:hypothetical protein